MKLVIYDFDGTLVDSRKDIAEAVNHMRRSLGGREYSRDEVIACVGNGVKDLVLRTITDLDTTFDVARKLLGEYYSAHPMDYTTLYPGVLDGVKKLQQAGFCQVLVSNKVEALCRVCLEQLGVAAYLDEIVGDGRYRLKPDPEALFAMQERFGIKPEDCWMFGDNWTDLAAGRNAGCRRVFATYGFGELNGETFDYKVDSFEEFVDLMQENR